MSAVPSNEPSDVRRWAARAWLEMERAGVLPSPRNFDLWFTHTSGADPELSRQIMAMLANKALITAETLEALRADFGDHKVDLDEFADRAEGMEQAAREIVDGVTSNSQHLREYGNTLDHWSAQLGKDRTLDSLLQALAALGTETARASERNRMLEQQLSASSARIVRLKGSLATMKREATTDLLTGLLNRKAFSMRLRRALSEAKSQRTPAAVLMLDVDHFKTVNDTYGHATGDLVLRLIGRLLLDSVKGCDAAARYGGEEFAILLAGADLQAGVAVANKIRLGLESKQLIKKRSTDDFGTITVSVGVAQFQPGEAATTLVDRADAAMYQAKKLGRNRVCVPQATPGREW